LGLVQLRAAAHPFKWITAVAFCTALLLGIFMYAVQNIVLIASDEANQEGVRLGGKRCLVNETEIHF